MNCGLDLYNEFIVGGIFKLDREVWVDYILYLFLCIGI